MMLRSQVLAVLLVALVCGAPAGAVLLADSEADFSGVQGQDDWFYGFVFGHIPFSPFEELEFFGSAQANMWSIEAATPPNVLIGADSMHSAVVDTTKAGVIEGWAARRWVSDVKGTVVISGRLESLEEGPTADGTTGQVRHNNTVRFEESVVNLSGVDFSVERRVDIGDTIDFVLDPHDDDSFDSTRFRATISVGGPEEPNDTMGTATPIACPFDSGVTEINPAGDVDFYSLDLLAGDVATFVAVGECGGIGSSLAPELEIFDAAGTSLAFNDDCDPQIQFTAPASGTYFARVRDSKTNFPVDDAYQLLVTCGSCAPTPAQGCFFMQKSSLAIKEKKPGNEKLKLTLKNPLQPLPDGALGDPLTTTTVAACLYDEDDLLVGELSVDPGGVCGTKAKPCWKAPGSGGFRYKDKDANSDGVLKLKGKSPKPEKATLQLKARNKEKKGQTAMPTGITAALEGDSRAWVQVVTSDAQCFEGNLGTIKKNDATQFKAKNPKQ
jgi:hypothetical protein